MASILFGLELETIPANEKSLSKSQLQNIGALLARVLEHSKPDAKKHAAVLHFTPEQLMLYELHELEPRTKDILEYLFGTGRGDNSYYDSVIGELRCIELKIKPCGYNGFLQNVETVLSLLKQKSAAYGVNLTDPKIQLNLSVWDNQVNLFDPLSREFLSKGAVLISAVMDNIYRHADQFDFLYISATGATPLISLNISRDGFARICGEGITGRLELRLSRCGATVSQMDLPRFINLIIAAIDDPMPANNLALVTRGIFHRKDDSLKVFTHLLQGSEIVKTSNPFVYKFHFPENYLFGWLYLTFSKICKELNFEPITPDFDLIKIKFLNPEKHHELAEEYRTTSKQRYDYLNHLNTKTALNHFERLEKDFLETHFDGRNFNWPDDTTFSAHFRAQAAYAMTQDQLLQFLYGIKIIKIGWIYKIIYTEETSLFGITYPVDTSIFSAIRMDGTCPGLTMPRRELPAR